MMDTQGPPPVAFPNHNLRDRPPKREREKSKASKKEAEKGTTPGGVVRSTGEASEESARDQAGQGQECGSTENLVDIRI